MLLGLVLTVMLLGSLNVHAQSTIYHVRTGATGSQNGSDWSNAYTSLPATLVRGATYYIADGSYSGRTFNTATSGTSLITIKKATIADHGTSTGWQNSYGDGQATFSGKIEFTSSYWVFDGQTGGGPENNWNQNFGFKITETGDANAVIRIGYTSPANNITIRHVDMQGKGSVSNQGGGSSNDGVAIYSASNITISYYWMHGIGRCPFYISPNNFIAEYGWVESFNRSSAVHSEIASIWNFDGNMGDTTFRYNLFTDIKSTGGLMWDNHANPKANLYIYGNVFYKPAGASWDVANGVIGGWTGGNGEEFHNCLVYNNAFINIDQQCLSTFPNIASGNAAYNNLFYNCQSPDFAKFATHDYNYFINSGGTHSEANGTSATSGDPFVNYVALNFSLKAPTAAGKSLPSPFTIDPAGYTRGSDGVWDRGAFEFGGKDSPAPLSAPSNLKLSP
jgi:hypothetical protein